MVLPMFKKLIFVTALGCGVALSAVAFGNEGKEEAKEEGGEGKGTAEKVPKDQKEFTDKTSRLNSLSSRIEESDKQFQELVRSKAEEKNMEEKQRLIKQMVEVTKERNKAAEEYMKLKTDLSLRYPNQGEHLNRRYQVQEKKSFEDMEGAAGLDELLTRTKKIVERKYAPFNDPEEDKKKAAKLKPEPTTEEKPKKLRLEK